MACADRWAAGLLVATAVHAGFQLTVTAVVYPALAEVPPAAWPAAHERHSRRIALLVAPVYAGLAVTGLGALVHDQGPRTLAVGLPAAGAVALTACVAAPLHRRLAQELTPARVRRLLRADRLRTLCALAALAAAVAVPRVGGG